jgi:hypothetical protein
VEKLVQKVTCQASCELIVERLITEVAQTLIATGFFAALTLIDPLPSR